MVTFGAKVTAGCACLFVYVSMCLYWVVHQSGVVKSGRTRGYSTWEFLSPRKYGFVYLCEKIKLEFLDRYIQAVCISGTMLMDLLPKPLSV